MLLRSSLSDRKGKRSKTNRIITQLGKVYYMYCLKVGFTFLCHVACDFCGCAEVPLLLSVSAILYYFLKGIEKVNIRDDSR